MGACVRTARTTYAHIFAPTLSIYGSSAPRDAPCAGGRRADWGRRPGLCPIDDHHQNPRGGEYPRRDWAPGRGWGRYCAGGGAAPRRRRRAGGYCTGGFGADRGRHPLQLPVRAQGHCGGHRQGAYQPRQHRQAGVGARGVARRPRRRHPHPHWGKLGLTGGGYSGEARLPEATGPLRECDAARGGVPQE